MYLPPVALHPLDHLLFVILALLFPARAVVTGYRRLARAPEADVPRVRLSLYREAIVIQWLLVILALVHWNQRGRGLDLLGLRPGHGWPFLVAVVAIALVLPIAARHIRSVARNDETLARVRRKLAHVSRLLPRTLRELRWFFAVSVTAGVCEEVLYRGFLIWYVAQVAIALRPGAEAIGLIVVAVAGASLVFGWSHAYQGWRGMLATGVVGLSLGIVYVVTGSLLVPMIAHALIDVHSGTLAYLAFSREPDLAVS